jgi:hypothetical protein
VAEFFKSSEFQKASWLIFELRDLSLKFKRADGRNTVLVDSANRLEHALKNKSSELPKVFIESQEIFNNIKSLF